MKYILSHIICLCIIIHGYSQSNTFTNDCKSAINIDAAKGISIPASPNGYGHINEFINIPKASVYYFEKEHNTIWYKFSVPVTSTMTFNITPNNKHDDYDFLLFKAKDTNTCREIQQKTIKPIRTNIARNDTIKNSCTGLSFLSNKEFVGKGPNDNFSKALEVNKGDVYYLVLDNVYNNGKGHWIKFNFYTLTNIEGKVTSDIDNTPVKADVSWSDNSTGQLLIKTCSDIKTGTYKMNVPIDAFNPKYEYALTITADTGYFFKDTIISAEQLKKINKPTFINRLQHFVIGKTYCFENVNFVGNQAIPLSSSYPKLEFLNKVMQKNKRLVIEIQGHTNNVVIGGNSFDQMPESFHKQLSKDRAITVYKYLLKNGIAQERMTTVGFGHDRMLYTKAKNEYEQSMNRRVEIKVIKY